VTVTTTGMVTACPADLTFEAEAFGKSATRQDAVTHLAPLLEHPSTIVREGAAIGLSVHLDDEVRALLAPLANEPSPGVSAVVRDILENA
jgi:hypothetical protein